MWKYCNRVSVPKRQSHLAQGCPVFLTWKSPMKWQSHTHHFWRVEAKEESGGVSGVQNDATFRALPPCWMAELGLPLSSSAACQCWPYHLLAGSFPSQVEAGLVISHCALTILLPVKWTTDIQGTPEFTSPLRKLDFNSGFCFGF